MNPVSDFLTSIRSRLIKKKTYRGKKDKVKRQSFESQQIAIRYCFAAVLFFGLQSVIATGGALELVWPDLPAPITFQDGRALHLNLSILWPTLGLMGLTYFFFIQESEVELYSQRLAKVQFWLFTIGILGIMTSLALGFNDGREYLEAKLPFRILLLVSLVIFAYNLVKTYLKPKANKRPTIIVILTGVISAIILFAPNLLHFPHPTVDDYVRFWVVHMWEELSFELVGTAVTISLLLSITNIKRHLLEKLLYLDASLIILTGFLATGHHYYWIGTPTFWIFVGGIFSTLQVIPIILVFYAFVKNINSEAKVIKDYVTIAFLGASSFWHLTGAGLLGLLMAIPSFNLYLHGTLVTSSHSHLALFGVFGILVLGGSYHIITKDIIVGRKHMVHLFVSFGLINLGLLTMGSVLFIAGLLQTYLWRVAGVDFMQVQMLLKPYYLARVFGGGLFTLGALLFTWRVITIIRNNKIKIF